MTQADLDRVVAKATGESVAMVRRLGFQLEDWSLDELDESIAEASIDGGPLVFDWDERTAVSFEEYGDAVE